MKDLKFLPGGAGTVTFANLQVQFCDEIGGTAAISEENMYDFFVAKGYDTEALEDLYGEDLAFCFRTSNQHWYLTIEADNDFEWGFIMDDYEIPAAMGLKVFASGGLTGGGYMILPPAIEKGE